MYNKGADREWVRRSEPLEFGGFILNIQSLFLGNEELEFRNILKVSLLDSIVAYYIVERIRCSYTL